MNVVEMFGLWSISIVVHVVKFKEYSHFEFYVTEKFALKQVLDSLFHHF